MTDFTTGAGAALAPNQPRRSLKGHVVGLVRLKYLRAARKARRPILLGKPAAHNYRLRSITLVYSSLLFWATGLFRQGLYLEVWELQGQ